MALLVSKLEAAAWLGIAPSTLSNYLRAGKISPSRLVGHGQRAKIDLNGAVAGFAQNPRPNGQPGP